MANEVEQLCEMLDDYQIGLDQDLPKHVWDFIREKKFLGIIIPESHVRVLLSFCAEVISQTCKGEQTALESMEMISKTY